MHTANSCHIAPLSCGIVNISDHDHSDDDHKKQIC
jgi:hypothetical protein